MATLTQTHAPLRIFDRLTALIADLRARHARYRLYRTTLDELQSLSMRDLADLGLHRSMLKSIAYEAAYGE